MSNRKTSSVEIVAAEILDQASAKKPRRERGTGGVRFDAKRQLYIATWPRPGQSPKTVYGKTQKEALDKLEEWKRDVASGRITEGVAEQLAALPSNPTVGEWIEYWLEHEVKPTYNAAGEREGGKQPTTHENYRWVCDRHIFSRAIAGKRLDKLTVGDVEIWWEAMTRAGVGMPSRYKAYVVLNGAITRAIKRRDVTALRMNPVTVFGDDDRVRKPTAEKKEAPTPEGVQALYAAVQGERLELVMHLGIRLGLRRQEIAALRFGDFDLAKGVLYIRRRSNRLKGQGVLVRSGSKMQDDSVEKPIPLSNPERWAMLLEEHKARTAAFALVNQRTWTGAEPTSPWAWLFPTRTGGPMDPNEIYRWWKSVAARAGQPDKTLHMLRHDYATLGIEAGMSLWEVSKVLRHSSTNVTESVYGHITGAHETRLYSRVDDAVDALLGTALGEAASG